MEPITRAMKINIPQKTHRFSSGFTLIEAMITISVLGILLSIAAPSFKVFIEKSRLSSVTNEIATDLFFIRSEALKRRINTYLCPKKSSVDSCERTVSNANYINGWLMYADCNGNGKLDIAMTCDLNGDGINDAPELLKVHDSLVSSVVIKTSRPFRLQAGYNMSSRATRTGSFCITLNDKRSKKVVVASTGRVQIRDIENCD